MKCIKSIKPTKNTEVGVIVRIDDIEAETKVKTGYCTYAPKSEYKALKKGVTVEKLQSTEQETKKNKS